MIIIIFIITFKLSPQKFNYDMLTTSVTPITPKPTPDLSLVEHHDAV